MIVIHCLGGLTMSVVYSLYDALVSINVPDNKAKAVIDALEREMMDKLATRVDVENLRLAARTDIEHVRETLSRDIEQVRETLSRDIRALEATTKADVAHLREVLGKDIQHQTNTMTLRLLITAAGLIPAIVAAQRLF